MWRFCKLDPGRPASSLLPESWHRSNWEAVAHRTMGESLKFSTASTEDLRSLAKQCRHKVKLVDDDERVIVEIFALVREIAGRVHGVRHHEVQILGALAMLHGRIAEMRTGEGKTLTSLMTVTFLALKGRGCHVFTANDYLAMRDHEFARPVLEWFGLGSGVLQDQTSDPESDHCDRFDVTYGSEKAFAFDFLRERLNRIETFGNDVNSTNRPTNDPVRKQRAYAVIDEADSILVDQASTPMIISYPRPASKCDLELYYWCEKFAGGLTSSVDFSMDPRRHSVRLSQRGCRKVRLTAKPFQISRLPLESLLIQIERALAARYFFHENREYLVVEGRVEVIDQGTGRILPGRKWHDGLQQAIEIQVGLEPSDTTGSAARITLQNFLKNYHFLCGMTGTATEARSEFRRTYGLRVMSIPTHHPCQLECLPTRIFANKNAKWAALTADVERVMGSRRAVLVGTSSIAASEHCASLLRARGCDVQILHAKHHQQESEIIKLAGQPHRITVATNMAGRGTDIKLHPDVRDAGGLHVILSEMNRSSRIDRQLAGRAARQGDPGSYQVFVSLEDELLSVLSAKRVTHLKNLAIKYASSELDGRWISCFSKAQRMCESRGELERKQLLAREREQLDAMISLGLDPCIELAVDE